MLKTTRHVTTPAGSCSSWLFTKRILTVEGTDNSSRSFENDIRQPMAAWFFWETDHHLENGPQRSNAPQWKPQRIKHRKSQAVKRWKVDDTTICHALKASRGGRLLQKYLSFKSSRYYGMILLQIGLLETNISPPSRHFWVDDFPYLKVAYVSSQEGKPPVFFQRLKLVGTPSKTWGVTDRCVLVQSANDALNPAHQKIWDGALGTMPNIEIPIILPSVKLT